MNVLIKCFFLFLITIHDMNLEALGKLACDDLLTNWECFQILTDDI